MFSCCYVQLHGVRRRACGTGGIALRYEPVCATQPPVFTGGCRGCGSGGCGVTGARAAVVFSDMSTITSQFSPLNPQVSPVSMESVDRVVDRRAGKSIGYFPCCGPVCANQPSGVAGIPKNRRISTPYLPCFVTGLTGLTGCGISAGRGGCVA